MDELRRLQMAELDILRKVIEICDRHQLTYYAVGGTLLGAVRHRGFIPWDDDIDISMPREDYEKFLEYAQNELQSPFQLNTIETCPNGFCYYYARCENRSVMIERIATKKKQIVPVWIDIFPLDHVPEEPGKLRNWMRLGKLYKKVFEASQYSWLAAEKSSSGNVMTFLKAAALKLHAEKLISRKLAWKLLDRHLKKYRYASCERVTNFSGIYGMREVTEKKVFGKGSVLVFEGIELMGPSDPDTYLKQIYGDYMTIPPQRERKQHNIRILR